MTLDTFEARTAQGGVLSLPLDDIVEGYSVQDITGLDPVKANINSSPYGGEDGEQYHSSSVGKRNIVLKLGLEADYSTQTARGLRSRLYDFFMPKSAVSLRFLDEDGSAAEIAGHVESFDAPVFVQNPAATISVICELPNFIDVNVVNLSGTSVSDLTDTQLNYAGTAETGFLFRLTLDRDLTEFSIKSRSLDGIIRSMDFAGDFKAGDTIEVSTFTGNKGAYLLRAGSRSSILYALSPASPWIHFYRGTNFFRVQASGAGLGYTIQYKNQYGGL